MKKGTTLLARTGCGKLYGTVNGTPPTQFIASIGKPGTCVRCQVSGQTALIDLALRKGATPKEIIEVLQGNKCHLSNVALGIKSCPDALADVFQSFIEGQ